MIHHLGFKQQNAVLVCLGTHIMLTYFDGECHLHSLIVIEMFFKRPANDAKLNIIMAFDCS